MQFTTFSLATLTAIAVSVVSAESDPFGIINTRSGTQFHYTSWGSDSKGNVVIQSLSKGATEFSSLHVEDDTSVKTSDGKYFVVNSDHSITLGDASAATKGFTIGTAEGALVPFNFNGQDSYVTCPNSAGDYVLYTENPANYNDKCSALSSWAVGDSGDVAAFSGDSSASSSSLSSSSSVPPTLVLAPTGYQNTSSTVVTSDVATTVITITSCAENKCTLYTTTCPITAIPTTTPISVTKAATPVPSVTTSEGTPSSTPSVATLTGGANVKLASSFAAAGALAIALIM